MRLIGEAVAAAPREARYRINLSAVLGQAERNDEALATARQVVASHPDLSEAHNNLGSALVRLGHCEEALACYDTAIGLRPDYDEALYNRGIALQSLGRHEAAAASYRQAIALQPDYVEAYNNLGVVLAALDRCEEAIANYDQAIALDPEYDEAFYNRGVALQALERHAAALASYDQAIALRPDHADALKNRGMVRQALDRHDAALADYAASLALRPDHAPTHFSRSLCLLQSGDLQGGWREDEWRWRMPQFQPGLRGFDQPLWLGGEPLAGRTILLHAEQGMGDTLQFCRYAAAVAARGATVVLEVPAPLTRLLAGLAGVARIVARGEPLPPFDLHCPLMSLPLALGTTLPTIPVTPGYLTADPAEVAAWRQRLAAIPGMRVGLAWAGSPDMAQNRLRSVPPEALAPLAAIPGVSLVSLQKGDDAAEAGAPLPLHDFTDELYDFADTAALVANLDLVISVCTSVAHLAGGLGRPVWVPLHFNACWRWLRRREDSPWYPTARLFRQTAPGDWDGVVASVAAALRDHAGGRVRAGEAPSPFPARKPDYHSAGAESSGESN